MKDNEFDEAVEKLTGAHDLLFKQEDRVEEHRGAVLGAIIRVHQSSSGNIFFPKRGEEIFIEMKRVLANQHQHLDTYRRDLTDYYVDVANGVNSQDMELFKQGLTKAKERNVFHQIYGDLKEEIEELRGIEREVTNEVIKGHLNSLLNLHQEYRDELNDMAKMDKAEIEEPLETIEKFMKGE